MIAASNCHWLHAITLWYVQDSKVLLCFCVQVHSRHTVCVHNTKNSVREKDGGTFRDTVGTWLRHPETFLCLFTPQLFYHQVTRDWSFCISACEGEKNKAETAPPCSVACVQSVGIHIFITWDCKHVSVKVMCEWLFLRIKEPEVQFSLTERVMQATLFHKHVPVSCLIEHCVCVCIQCIYCWGY